jgi:hypothetical protein
MSEQDTATVTPAPVDEIGGGGPNIIMNKEEEVVGDAAVKKPLEDEEDTEVKEDDTSDPAVPTVWQARRRRRRDRQRAAKQAADATHDKTCTSHHATTANRFRREAIRAQLREAMLAPWNDGGAGGLRVVIDCG